MNNTADPAVKTTPKLLPETTPTVDDAGALLQGQSQGQLQQPPQALSLEQLRDIQLPDPIGIWPPAPGWWLLGLIAIVALLWLSISLRRHWLSNRYRRLALRELSRLNANQATRDQGKIQSTLLTQIQMQERVQQLNQLLKRTALQGFSSTVDKTSALAALNGQPWLDFLYRSSRIDAFRQPLGQRLAHHLYQPASDLSQEQLEQLQQLVKQWIKQHRCSRLKPSATTTMPPATAVTAQPASPPAEDASRFQRPRSAIKPQEELC